MTLPALLGFIFGLQFGSFITLAAHRLPEGTDIVYLPSRCPRCLHRLSIRDLFPLFSWIFSRGRCRYCKTKVSIRYPLIEAGAGVIGAALCVLHDPFSLGFWLRALALIYVYCALVMCIEKKHIPLFFYAPFAAALCLSPLAGGYYLFAGAALALTAAGTFYIRKKKHPVIAFALPFKHTGGVFRLHLCLLCVFALCGAALYPPAGALPALALFLLPALFTGLFPYRLNIAEGAAHAFLAVALLAPSSII